MERLEQISQQFPAALKEARDEIRKSAKDIEDLQTQLELAKRRYHKAEDSLRREQETNKARRGGTDDDDISSAQTVKQLREKLDTVNKELKEAKAELDETKSRLSRQMGIRLTDGNPDIADLSDKNRPTKIGERYSELYDNQWTDAYEKLDKGDEKETVRKLLQIFCDALDFCQKRVKEQMEKLEDALLFGNREKTNISTTVKKQLKECRKQMADTACSGLLQRYMSDLERSHTSSAIEALKVKAYVEESFKIAWLMAIQDPPVFLGNYVRYGDPFDCNNFRTYTRAGSKIDFMVWAPLLICKGGHILVKGVAQCVPLTSRPSSAAGRIEDSVGKRKAEPMPRPKTSDITSRSVGGSQKQQQFTSTATTLRDTYPYRYGVDQSERSYRQTTVSINYGRMPGSNTLNNYLDLHQRYNGDSALVKIIMGDSKFYECEDYLLNEKRKTKQY